MTAVAAAAAPAPAAAAAAASEGGQSLSLPLLASPSPPAVTPQPQPPPPPPSSSSSSECYDRFLALACEAFGVLRSPNAAPLLLQALHLASQCAAPDIARAPAQAVLFVSGRLRPGDHHHSEESGSSGSGAEAAARALADAIAEGAAALVPALLDTTHRWAQSWR